jgi:hypothetical protein
MRDGGELLRVGPSPGENILGQPNFSASQSKKYWNQSQSAKFPFRLATQGLPIMTGSLLDECCESILKIAETQPPVGKMAISMLAEMFRENSGRARDGRPSSSQDFQAPDRQPIPFRGRTPTRHALKG